MTPASQQPESELASQQDFVDAIAKLSPGRDLLLVKLLVTNLPIINSQFGEKHGDEVLGDIAARISDLPHAQLVAQISPVLYGVIAEDESKPSHFLKSIREIITDINASGRFRFLVETSIGAVVTDHRAKATPLDWIARLNLAVLKSTRTGNPEISDELVAESEGVRQELARLSPGSAVPEGMYWVFQPINDAKTREVFGYETLCRWDIPGLGEVSPAVFIQIAEDMNLVQLIDFWTIAAVERAYPELVKLGGQMITVNVSAQTLGSDHEFFHAVDRLLPRIRDAHFSLVFELTETSIIKNQIELNASLASLRKRGAKIAIDDFGTGQTSLSISSSLPTDFVKLDGSLLQAERPDLSRGLLELGMKFAELVGAKVVVEKVETEADLELAREVGADYVQGWLFGKPVAFEKPPQRVPKPAHANAKKASPKASRKAAPKAQSAESG
jgi:EAL domain-containing protein (putative c-di-GMP-specific phosphodiesterase class I)/GGDEF domain-containing protein